MRRFHKYVNLPKNGNLGDSFNPNALCDCARAKNHIEAIYVYNRGIYQYNMATHNLRANVLTIHENGCRTDIVMRRDYKDFGNDLYLFIGRYENNRTQETRVLWIYKPTWPLLRMCNQRLLAYTTSVWITR